MEHTLPLAERFHSIQGEGTYTGTPMHFIRLAGCNVGQFVTDSQLPVLQSGKLAATCKTYDGREFFCDTDFSLNARWSPEALIDDTYEQHICLTGGEPLLHQKNPALNRLFVAAAKREIMIHIETSGTIDIDWNLFDLGPEIWISCAPKFGYLPNMIDNADEIKLLVDENFDLTKIPEGLERKRVFLSPVNNEKDVINENLWKAIEILKSHPGWRLSAQLHKYIGVR